MLVWRDVPAIELYVDAFDQPAGTAFVESLTRLRKAVPVLSVLYL